MQIDIVSKKIVTLALYLDDIRSGSVSEIWLDNDLVETLRDDASQITSTDKYIKSLKNEIEKLTDQRRKQYLKEILRSIQYQLDLSDWNNVNLEEFSKNCFGIAIPNVSDSQITKIDEEISNLEKRIGKDRSIVLEGSKVQLKDLDSIFLKELEIAKTNVNSILGNEPENEKFSLKLVTNESWSAFNKHINPFESELLINTDQSVTKRDLQYLAYHEGYGGHHTELSFKDQLLVNEGRGEHGLIITYSPQTFISEAIAVNSETWFNNAEKDLEAQLCGLYGEFSGGILLIRVAYMYHQEGKTMDYIKSYLDGLNITDESKNVIIGFCTDKTYGIYTLIYNFAERFLYNKWKNSSNKLEFLNTIYTKPTTPSML